MGDGVSMKDGQRVALVSGGGKGIGLALVRAMLVEGYAVAAADRDAAALLALEAAVTPGKRQRLLTLSGDLSVEGAAEEAIVAVEGRFGGVDILVNNDGIGMASLRSDYSTRPIRFWEVTPAQWSRFIAVNATAGFCLAGLVAPAMVGRGFGRIVNVTTSLGTMLRGGFSAYGHHVAAGHQRRRTSERPRPTSLAPSARAKARARPWSWRSATPRAWRPNPSKRAELPDFHRLDLEGEILRVNPALRQATGDEPQTLLRRALEHVVQFAIRADAPDRPDAIQHGVADCTPDEFLLRIVAGRQDDEVGRHRRAIAQQRALGRKAFYPVILEQAHLTLDHEVGAARIEIVATAAPKILHLMASLVRAEIMLEADALEALNHLPVQRVHALGDGFVRLDDQRRRGGGDDQVAILERPALIPDCLVEPGARVDRDHGCGAPLDNRRVHAMA
ncbi:MAG: SDR family oxidoreductase, partial [Rhodospirillales bacterium]|nr:SDR family oxidoreductase [Rhodospirillales bacterium]